MSKLLALLIRKIAEGDFGELPKKVYWSLAGIKTYLAAALAILAYSLGELTTAGICPPCAGYQGWVYSAAAFLASIGLIDGALRTAPPNK